MANLLLHEAEMFGNVLLVLSVVFLRQLEDSVAKPEYVFVGSVSRIRELLNLQHRTIAILGLGEGGFEDAKELLEDVLLPQQLLSVSQHSAPDVFQLHLKWIRFLLVILHVRQEVDDVLEQVGQRLPLIVSDLSFLQFSCHRLQHLHRRGFSVTLIAALRQVEKATLQASVAKSRSLTSLALTALMAKASLSSLMAAEPTIDITGFSSSRSMGMDVECTLVQRQV